MYRLLLCLLLILVTPTRCSNRWALLISGGKGYEFYRHQSCAYRVRHFLNQSGFDMNNIITFANRPAFGSRNKDHDGTLYNRPGGPDVYGGVRPDYEGNELNVKNLEYALHGDNRAHGPYLRSTAEDYVFIYYAGFGGRAVVRFGEIGGAKIIADKPRFLYRNQFQSIIERMIQRKLFKKLFIFFETSAAATMLRWLDQFHVANVYAIGTSSAAGKSYARYCPSIFDDYPIPGITDTCLSMRATALFFETAERVDLERVNLGYLFDFVKRKVLGGKAPQHLTEHGDLSLRRIKAAQFFGPGLKAAFKALNVDDKYLQKIYESGEAWSDFNHEEMALRFVMERLKKKGGGKVLESKMKEVTLVNQFLATISGTISSMVFDLFHNSRPVSIQILERDLYVETNFTCFREIFERFEKCMNDYHSHALMHAHVFYAMCSVKKTEDILKVFSNHHCS